MEDTHWGQIAGRLQAVCHRVLILVLMEDTHWDFDKFLFFWNKVVVLILVLMEDTHWEKKSSGRRSKKVLILVLMEDTHWVGQYAYFNAIQLCGLNPCFNGRYSLSFGWDTGGISRLCLNPCFNGRYSLRGKATVTLVEIPEVLILVLMEDTHWVYFYTYNNEKETS